MSTSNESQSIQIGSGESFCQLEFLRTGDRWSHHFLVTRSGETSDAFRSVEGTAEDVWPASPPFQELSIESRDDQKVALLVGMSGKSHWSASVTSVITDEYIGWEFDVACLAKQPPEKLGSNYSCKTNGTLAIKPISGCQLSQSEQQLQLLAEPVGSKIPQTICWKYQIVTMLR